MIDRRAFVAGLGAVFATPFATAAQPTPKLPRVGYASLNTRTVTVPRSAWVNNLLRRHN
jgi:hypothetical protein